MRGEVLAFERGARAGDGGLTTAPVGLRDDQKRIRDARADRAHNYRYYTLDDRRSTTRRSTR
jgi:hypothetical protein